VSNPSEAATFTVVVAIVTGILAVAAWLLRLGLVANFISEPVLKGFIIGLALTIIVGQVPTLLGIEKGGGELLRADMGVLTQLGEAQGLTMVVGFGSLAVVLLLRRFAPAVPGSLVAVLGGIALVSVFDLADDGLEIVGDIDSGLPSVGLPDGAAFTDYLTAVASCVGIMLVGFVEGLGAGKTYASAITMRSIRTASCWGWARPTSGPAWPAG
jgi:sulfate permease, SulP family